MFIITLCNAQLDQILKILVPKLLYKLYYFLILFDKIICLFYDINNSIIQNKSCLKISYIM